MEYLGPFSVVGVHRRALLLPVLWLYMVFREVLKVGDNAQGDGLN